jgi:hypothetical protein
VLLSTARKLHDEQETIMYFYCCTACGGVGVRQSGRGKSAAHQAIQSIRQSTSEPIIKKNHNRSIKPIDNQTSHSIDGFMIDESIN